MNKTKIGIGSGGGSSSAAGSVDEIRGSSSKQSMLDTRRHSKCSAS